MSAMPMKKPSPDMRPKREEFVAPDDSLSKDFPCLWGYLSNTRWDNGDPRTTATLMFFVDSGCLKACLNDRANDRSAFFTGPSLPEILFTVETKLLDDTCDWRYRKASR